jgi:hypothetical protein
MTYIEAMMFPTITTTTRMLLDIKECCDCTRDNNLGALTNNLQSIARVNQRQTWDAKKESRLT